MLLMPMMLRHNYIVADPARALLVPDFDLASNASVVSSFTSYTTNAAAALPRPSLLLTFQPLLRPMLLSAPGSKVKMRHHQ
jgi:hypothetical protein